MKQDYTLIESTFKYIILALSNSYVSSLPLTTLEKHNVILSRFVTGITCKPQEDLWYI